MHVFKRICIIANTMILLARICIVRTRSISSGHFCASSRELVSDACASLDLDFRAGVGKVSTEAKTSDFISLVETRPQAASHAEGPE